jgi:hypothetical protein
MEFGSPLSDDPVSTNCESVNTDRANMLVEAYLAVLGHATNSVYGAGQKMKDRISSELTIRRRREAAWLRPRLRCSHINKMIGPPVYSHQPIDLTQQREHLLSTVPLRVVDYKRSIALIPESADTPCNTETAKKTYLSCKGSSLRDEC